MAHYRKAVGAAVALNTGIFVVEAVAGFQAQSLSLIMDSVHNLSDEMALVFIYLALILSQGVSRNLLRSANIFNSIGLIVVSGLLLWQSVERLLNPARLWVRSQLSSALQPPRQTGELLGCFGRLVATTQQSAWPTSTIWATFTSSLLLIALECGVLITAILRIRRLPSLLWPSGLGRCCQPGRTRD